MMQFSCFPRGLGHTRGSRPAAVGIYGTARAVKRTEGCLVSTSTQSKPLGSCGGIEGHRNPGLSFSASATGEPAGSFTARLTL